MFRGLKSQKKKQEKYMKFGLRIPDYRSHFVTVPLCHIRFCVCVSHLNFPNGLSLSISMYYSIAEAHIHKPREKKKLSNKISLLY